MFGDKLLQHTRVCVEYCMHTAAFFYFPTEELVDHFESNLFLKDEDWRDDAAVNQDNHDCFNFGGEFSMIPSECIELKGNETHQDGATFQYFP